MKNRKHLAVSLVIALALAGCAGGEAVKPSSDEKGATSAQTSPAGDKSGTAGTGMSDREKQRRAELLSQRRVHFAFDSSSIDDEARAIIEAHAAYLVANSQLKLTLEGNCDERGSTEYNLGLGQRRADGVKKMLELGGAKAAQLNSVSYGEEKPKAAGHNEAAWEQNRRTDLNYAQ